MKDGADIEALLDSLDALVSDAEGKGARWRDVWSEIKNIGQGFKEVRFPSPQERQAAWKRFQGIVGRVKTSQQRASEAVEKNFRESERHLEQLRSYAWKATPSSGSADAIIAIATGGLSVLVQAGLDAILGPFDERKLELQRCNEILKEGWAYLSDNKGEMLGKHKKEAFDALSKASDSLGSAWDMWKTGRQEAADHYRSQKREAWEARQAKHEAWETRTRERLANLEDRVSRLEGVLEHKRSNLSKLEDMRDSAHSDTHRERVDGWIEEERDKIADIERKIDQIKGWIAETESKLR